MKKTAFLFVFLVVVISSSQTHGKSSGLDDITGDATKIASDLQKLFPKVLEFLGDPKKLNEAFGKVLAFAEPLIPGISEAYAKAKGETFMEKLQAILPLIAAKVPALTAMMGR